MTLLDQAKELSSLFANHVGRLIEDERRVAIDHLLISLMDVTEQSATWDMVIAAHAAFDVARREDERRPLPAPVPVPPPAASLPPDRQVICRVRIEIERLASGGINVWIDSGPTSPETPFLGVNPTGLEPLVVAKCGRTYAAVDLLVAGGHPLDITGAGLEPTRAKRLF